MESFAGKLAVVTGGGSGMGRELVRQLAAEGCSVAACDWHADAVARTAATAQADAAGVLVTSHTCDVADEAQVLRFRDELLEQHGSDHVDLVFANAGVGGAGSFVRDSRENWERTFAIDWWGVYYCARAFLPLLIASGDGVLVNTSSVNGLWASSGPGSPNTAYASAKFAVRGFTEALIEDLRTNAPQVRVAVVMPGHVGTDIIANSFGAHGLPDPEQMSDAQVEQLISTRARAGMVRIGMLAEDASADDLRQALARMAADFRDKAPLSASDAVAIILDGVRRGDWRILVGEDAKVIDTAVRSKPEAAYDYAELFRGQPQRPSAEVSGTKTLHTAYRVTDLAASLDFYTALGYGQVGSVDVGDGRSLTMLKFPGEPVVTLELAHQPGMDAVDVGTGFSHLVVQVDDIAATVEALSQAGLEPGPVESPGGPDGAQTSWLTDPDGYRIELVQWPPDHADGLSPADFA